MTHRDPEGEEMNGRRLLAFLSTALAALGLSTAAAVGLGLTLPVAQADALGNGYDVTCTKANENQVMCNVSGCPRVFEDLAGDVVHIKINGGPQDEIGKACGATIAKTVNSSAGFDFAVQGCRKVTIGGDHCGAWSNYTYTPPAAPQEAPKPETPPAPQTKVCPGGGPTIPVADTCPEKKKAPTDAVSMNVAKNLTQVNVTVSNSSDLAAQCTYDATEVNGLGFPVHRDFSVAAKGSTTLNFPAPLITQTYQIVTACNANFEGQQVEIGRATGSA
jgi:hypothetical protein